MTISLTKAKGQRQVVLDHLLKNIGRPMTTREMRECLDLERVPARIGELQAAGWDIQGASAGLGLGPDGTQLYCLVSSVQGRPRRKLVGITLVHHGDEEPVARIHLDSMSPLLSGPDRDAEQDLLGRVASAYRSWMQQYESDHAQGANPVIGRGALHIEGEDLSWVDAVFEDAGVTEVPDDATDDEAPEAPDHDDTFIDFTLPSLDDHAARLAEHPAWPWVCMSADGDGVVEVDYSSLSMG